MTLPHIIRLRHPWECERVARETREPVGEPAVRCTRRFNAPTNLDVQQRVWLVCDALDTRAHFELNGRSLGTIEGHCPQPRIDLTDVLQPHNVLVIEIELSADDQQRGHAAPGPWGLPGGLGEVRLEIARHAPDWRIDELDDR
jgi:hypothetical protein